MSRVAIASVARLRVVVAAGTPVTRAPTPPEPPEPTEPTEPTEPKTGMADCGVVTRAGVTEQADDVRLVCIASSVTYGVHRERFELTRRRLWTCERDDDM